MTRITVSNSLSHLPQLLVITLFMLYATFFVVDEGECVIITRLGRPIRQLDHPGGYWRWPAPIDRIERIDRRKQHYGLSPRTCFTRDKRQVLVTTFALWHVEDPLRFMQSVRTENAAAASLDSLIAAAQAEQIATRTLDDLLQSGHDTPPLEMVEHSLADQVNRTASSRLGIVVDQVGIERLSLPPANLAAVMARMRAEREAEANRLRAEGARQAQAIRDEAHVASQDILRAGRERASTIIAEGEATALRALQAAVEDDPEFFRFWTSLQATKRVLQQNATLIFNSDELFFSSLVSESPSNDAPPVTDMPVDRSATSSDLTPDLRRAEVLP